MKHVALVLSTLVLLRLGYSSTEDVGDPGDALAVQFKKEAPSNLGKAELRVNSKCVDLWNQFRGPNGSGVAVCSQPPIRIDSAKPTWKVAVPIGHSSPVLTDERIFLTGINEGQLVTLAYEKATGKLAWRRKAPKVSLEKVHKANNHAAPSAVKALGTSSIQPKRPKKRRNVEVLMPAILHAGERVDRRPQ